MKIKVSASCLSVAIILCITGCLSVPTTITKKQNINEMILAGKSNEAKELFQAKIDINEIDENGNTALHTAAKINDTDLVTFLVYKGANAELKNHSGDTPLHIAIKNDAKESASILATVKGNIFARDGNGKTALDLGLEKGLSYFDVLITTKTGLVRDEKDRNLVHYIVLNNNTDALKYCIQKSIPLSYVDIYGKSPLALCYEKNDSIGISMASELILDGASPIRQEYSYFEDSVKIRNPNLRFDDGQTPLHFASIYGHDAICSYLLSKGASTKAKDILGSTPLHEAVRYGNYNIVQLLLQNGSDPNSQDSLGKTPLLLIIPKEQRTNIYSALLTAGANPNAKDMYGDTPMHIATMNGMETEVLQTLKTGGADINERNKKGITPMSLAVDRLWKEHVEFYASCGADIHAEDNEGKSPLSRILSTKANVTSTELLQIMVNSKNINSRDSYGNTPIHIAISSNSSTDQVKYLLSLTSDVDARNRNGDSPLYIAVQKNRRVLGEMLLAKGADVFSTNNENYSPLRMALVSGGEAQEWILTSEVIKQTDGTGNTPLHYASEWKLDNAVSVLLEKGANPNTQNANGETPIFSAIKSDSTSTIDLLIRKGSQKNARDYLGNTPLHACVRWDAKNSAMKLIQWKADINMQNLAGKTPLSEAARAGRISMVTLLLDNKANIDATDATGKTVLMDAIQSGKIDIVSLLLNRGASVQLQEMYGRNAYHEASLSGNPKLIALLQSAGGNPLSRDAQGVTPFSLVLNKKPEIIKAVLGSDKRLLDSDSNTPIHIALQNKANSSIIELLVSMQYPLNTRNKDGLTPLSIAVKANMTEQAKVLLENGADPFITDNERECPLSLAFTKQEDILNSMVKFAGNKTDYQGDGILHYAARIADVQTIQRLLSMGLDRTARNISGETPRDIAIRWQRNDIAELLK